MSKYFKRWISWAWEYVFAILSCAAAVVVQVVRGEWLLTAVWAFCAIIWVSNYLRNPYRLFYRNLAHLMKSDGARPTN